MKKKLPSVATATENKIESCANAIQVFFIIMGVLILIGGVTMYGTLGMLGVFIGIAYCIGCILCGVALWAVLKGLATISVTLKHLRNIQDPTAFAPNVRERAKSLEWEKFSEYSTEIKQRPRLELEKQTTNTKTQEKGFNQGEEVIVCSLGCTATIQYFTDEGNVIAKTPHGSVALYFDDIKKL